jgi:XTP/dITP diphosphohydrolase
METKKRITFVTKNQEKMDDIRSILGKKFSISFVTDLDLIEIQSLDVQEVVAFKTKQAFQKIQTAVAVSDSGLEINSLSKFPGALVKFTNETIGQEGLVKLLEDKKNRQAAFVAAIGYCDVNLAPKIFVQRDYGTIAQQPKGQGWHFDRIFIPKGAKQTWAEMGRDRKNTNSAFRRALEALAHYLDKSKEKKK